MAFNHVVAKYIFRTREEAKAALPSFPQLACRNCGTDKTRYAVQRSDGRFYLQRACPKCRSVCNQRWRQAHPDQFREQWKRANFLLKMKVLSHYSLDSQHPACVCCGESEILFLSIDHINNDGWKERRFNLVTGKRTGNLGGVNLYQKLVRMKYPSGFQTLCHNCNRGKWINKGVCPHQAKLHHSYGHGILSTN